MIIKKNTKVWIITASSILFIISAVLNINLYIQFSDNIVIKIALVLLSIVFDAARIAAWVIGAIFIYQIFIEKKLSLILPAVGCIIIYLLLASIVGLATIGFTAGNFSRQQNEINKITEKDAQEKDRIQQINTELKLEYENKQKLLSLSNTSQWIIDKINYRIDRLKRQQEIKTVNVEPSKILNMSITIFDAIQSVLGVKSGTLKRFLLIVFSIILELLLQITNSFLFLSEYIKKRPALSGEKIEKSEKLSVENKYLQIIRDNKDKILLYIDALADIPLGLKRLNANSKIMDKTKLKENECEIYKEILNNGVKIGGVPLIRTAMGASILNFPIEKIKHNILSIVKQ